MAAQMFIFWGSFAYLPFAGLCLWLVRRGHGAVRWAALFALIATSVLAYARFVEPRLLRVEEAVIALPGSETLSVPRTLRIALVGDTHYGVYAHAMPMHRIVDTIAAQDVDAVFLAGDFVYYAGAEGLAPHVAPLAELEIPVFAVLGNHDVGFPGPDATLAVLGGLTRANVAILDNRAQRVELGGHDVVVAGASDLWQGRQSFGFSVDLPDRPVILLAHNPDTALSVPASLDYDVLLAGHTHGGQIRLPVLFERAIPTRWPFDKGLHTFPSENGERPVYVTPGTGMVGLPMRFLMPPQVDILTLQLPPDPPAPPVTPDAPQDPPADPTPPGE